jgi:hypothetical protein
VLSKFSKDDMMAMDDATKEGIATLCYDLAEKMILEDRTR